MTNYDKWQMHWLCFILDGLKRRTFIHRGDDPRTEPGELGAMNRGWNRVKEAVMTCAE
jgi:hypothetical protein